MKNVFYKVLIALAVLAQAGCAKDAKKDAQPRGGEMPAVISEAAANGADIGETAQTETQMRTSAQELNITKYVAAQAGLRVRAAASLEAERLGVLPNESAVRVIRESGSFVEIDGVRGQWVFVRADNLEGWVFDGYLSSENPSLTEALNNAVAIILKDIRDSYRTYDLKYIERVDIGIHGVDCFLVVFDFGYEEGWFSNSYHLIGLKNDDLVINKNIGWSYDMMKHYSEYAERIIAPLERKTSFTRIGSDVVYLGDINGDGKNEIILFSVGDGDFNIPVRIFGTNDGSIIEEYYSHAIAMGEGGDLIVIGDDGNFKINISLGGNLYVDVIWDNDQRKYILQW